MCLSSKPKLHTLLTLSIIDISYSNNINLNYLHYISLFQIKKYSLTVRSELCDIKTKNREKYCMAVI